MYIQPGSLISRCGWRGGGSREFSLARVNVTQPSSGGEKNQGEEHDLRRTRMISVTSAERSFAIDSRIMRMQRERGAATIESRWRASMAFANKAEKRNFDCAPDRQASSERQSRGTARDATNRLPDPLHKLAFKGIGSEQAIGGRRRSHWGCALSQ